MIIVHEVNPVDALRELQATLLTLDRSNSDRLTTVNYQLDAAKRAARLEVLRSIAEVSKVLRMGQFPEPKEGG